MRLCVGLYKQKWVIYLLGILPIYKQRINSLNEEPDYCTMSILYARGVLVPYA